MCDVLQLLFKLMECEIYCKINISEMYSYSLPTGVFTQRLPLSTQTALGDWQIEVIAQVKGEIRVSL